MLSFLLLLATLILPVLCATNPAYAIYGQSNVAASPEVGKLTYELAASIKTTATATETSGVATIINNTPMTMLLKYANTPFRVGQPTIAPGSAGMYSWIGGVNSYLACLDFVLVEQQSPNGVGADTLVFCFYQYTANQLTARMWKNPPASIRPPTVVVAYEFTSILPPAANWKTVDNKYPINLKSYYNYTTRFDATTTIVSTYVYYWTIAITDTTIATMQC